MIKVYFEVQHMCKHETRQKRISLIRWQFNFKIQDERYKHDDRDSLRGYMMDREFFFRGLCVEQRALRSQSAVMILTIAVGSTSVEASDSLG